MISHSLNCFQFYFNYISLSLFVEFLNLKMKKNKKPVQLHNNTILDEKLKDEDFMN